MKLFFFILSLAALMACSKELPTSPPMVSTGSIGEELIATCSNLEGRDKSKVYVFNYRYGIVVKLYNNSLISTDLRTKVSKELGRQTILIKGCKIDFNDNWDALVTVM